jgi:hypothetical protein
MEINRCCIGNRQTKCPADLKREAIAAWKRFVSCAEMLPPDQAAPFWQAALAEVTAMAHRHP